MFFRYLVLGCYLLQTILSAMPTPCYGMELVDDETQGLKSSSHNNYDSVSLDSVHVQAEESEISFLDSGSNVRLTLEADSFLGNEYQNQTELTYPEKLKMNFNALIKQGKGSILAAAKEKSSQDVNSIDVVIESGIILKPSRSSKIIDEILFKKENKNAQSKTWSDTSFKGIIFLWSGANLIGYAMSPWAIDPTRLFLAGNVFPLAAQTVAAINLSISMSAYHTPLYLSAGYYKGAEIYKNYAQNWGVYKVHGFMTLEDDLYESRRAVEPILKAFEKANFEEAKELYIQHAENLGCETIEYIKENMGQNKDPVNTPKKIVEFLFFKDANIIEEMLDKNPNILEETREKLLKHFKSTLKEQAILHLIDEVQERPHIATIPKYFNESSRLRSFFNATFSRIENFWKNYIYDTYDWKTLLPYPVSSKIKETSEDRRIREEEFERFFAQSVLSGEIGFMMKDNLIFCKIDDDEPTVILKDPKGTSKESVSQSCPQNFQALYCSSDSFDDIVSAVQASDGKLKASTKDEMRTLLKKGNGGANVGNWLTDACEVIGREFIYALAPLFVGLLYSTIFVDAEVNNYQTLYAYCFAIPAFYFFYMTLRDVAEKWRNWDNHDKMNKANDRLYLKKESLQRSLKKCKEWLNVDAENTNTFVKLIDEAHQNQEKQEEMFLLGSYFLRAGNRNAVNYKELQGSLEPMKEKFNKIGAKYSQYEVQNHAFQRLTNENFDSAIQNENLFALRFFVLQESTLKYALENIVSVAGVLGVIPEFLIYTYIANAVLTGLQIDETPAYWTSIPIGVITAGFNFFIGGAQYYAKTYADFHEHLSGEQPLSTVKRLLFPVILASTVWSLFAYWGALFDVTDATPEFLKWALISVLTAKELPRLMSWEYDIYEKLLSSSPVFYCIFTVQRCFNYLISKYPNSFIANKKSCIYKIFTYPLIQKIKINRDAKRIEEFIHKADEPTTNMYLAPILGM